MITIPNDCTASSLFSNIRKTLTINIKAYPGAVIGRIISYSPYTPTESDIALNISFVNSYGNEVYPGGIGERAVDCYSLCFGNPTHGYRIPFKKYYTSQINNADGTMTLTLPMNISAAFFAWKKVIIGNSSTSFNGTAIFKIPPYSDFSRLFESNRRGTRNPSTSYPQLYINGPIALKRIEFLITGTTNITRMVDTQTVISGTEMLLKDSSDDANVSQVVIDPGLGKVFRIDLLLSNYTSGGILGTLDISSESEEIKSWFRTNTITGITIINKKNRSRIFCSCFYTYASFLLIIFSL